MGWRKSLGRVLPKLLKGIWDIYLLLESLKPLVIGNGGRREVYFRSQIGDKEEKGAGEILTWLTYFSFFLAKGQMDDLVPFNYILWIRH